MRENTKARARRQHRSSLKQRIKVAKRERTERARDASEQRSYRRDRERRERAFLDRQKRMEESAALWARYSAAVKRAMFIGGVSYGPLDDPLGPREEETMGDFWQRVWRETPPIHLYGVRQAMRDHERMMARIHG